MEGLLILCFTALSTLLALYFLKFSGGKSKPKHKLPPGPWTLPIIGSLHHVISTLPHRRMTELSRRYGPVMLLKLGEVPAVFISSSEAAAEVLKTNDLAFASRPSSVTLDIFGGGGKDIAFAPYGDRWRQMRKVCVLELLSAKQVRRMESIRAQEVGNRLASITASNGATLNVSHMVAALSVDVVTQAVFGGKFRQQDEFLHEVDKAFALVAGSSLVDLFPSSRLVRKLSSGERLMRRCYGRIQHVITDIIDERKAARDASGGICSTNEEDLLGVLLRLQLEDSLQFPLTAEVIGAVLFRDETPQTSSNNLRASNSHSQQSNDRWEAAAWDSEKRRQEASSTGGGKPVAAQGAGASSLLAAGDPAPCLHCNIVGHYTARCPTIRCDRCKKLGHISQICQTVLPWECVPSMCGFQAPGRGFFYMPDQSSSKLIKERATSVVITIIEGNATSREIEQSFNIIFGDSWRCTARAIGPNQYTMRFPTPREVERAVCYGASMKLKTVDATVNLSPWTASVGAKAPLQKAWVKISNIPLDKRCETNVFYAGGLVGVSLDLDTSTLHKPEYVKVLIGCRDIEMIPLSAEGCLGDNFYDFYYEIDKIVVGKLPSDTTNVNVGNSGAPSPKRQRVEQNNIVTEENSGSQLVSSQTESVQPGRHRENVTITDATEEVDTQESEDDSTGGELLIETMAREHADAQHKTGTPPNKWLVPCPILTMNDSVHCDIMTPMVAPLSSLLLPFPQTLSEETWPSLPVITDVSDSNTSPLDESPGYLVQSPDVSLEDNVEEIQTELDPSLSSRRASADMNTTIMDKVENVARKRNLEGLQKVEDKDCLIGGANKMVQAAAFVYSRSRQPAVTPGQGPMLMITGA
ncbi:hypothetical protein ACQ4PT_071276 [Festuca glaucescens]